MMERKPEGGVAVVAFSLADLAVLVTDATNATAGLPFDRSTVHRIRALTVTARVTP